MNALTTAGPGSIGGHALIPRNMGEAIQLADMMAKAGFLARELQTPGGALFVIEQSMRWNMSPFAVAMETSFIQGKPMFSGKIVAAACASTGNIEGRLDYEYSGAGDDRTVRVIGRRRGETAPREVTVRLRDARTNNRMWQTQPDQQLAYHGARVWARRYTPEVMLGVNSPEEWDGEPREVEALDVTPEPAPVEMPRHPINNSNTMQSQGFDAVDDALAMLATLDDVRGYLATPKYQRFYAKVQAAGASERLSEIVQRHMARVMPAEEIAEESEQ